MKSINPATGETIREYKKMDDGEIDSIISDTREAQREWRQYSFGYRAEKLNNAASLLEEQSGSLAELMALEMGKPLAQGWSEAEKCAWVCRYYAENAESFLDREVIESDATESYVTFSPLGTVLAIMPWNFPLWQVFRFGAPALMAGNAAVLKHAPNVTGCALEIESLLHEAGIPRNLFRTIIADVDQTQDVIQHENIHAVTLTGSTRAGRAVARQAGGELKKTVLELGGSDPYVVLEDADLEAAVETCVNSRLINSGQSCIAAKRLIVHESLYAEFLDRVVQMMKGKKVGDPFDDETDIGPMARVDLRDELHRQVSGSFEQGATVLLGGEMPEGKGAFYSATVLADVTDGMPAYEEELFGPVATVIKAESEQEALRIANDNKYGLGAAIFSKNEKRAEKLAVENLEAGCVFINEYVKSDPRLPFGGVKNSGYGRELSHYGIKEFVNIKTVYRS